MNQDVRLRNGIAIQSRTTWYRIVQPLGAGVNASTHLVVAHRMLQFAPEQRDSAERFIDPWQGIFQEAVARALAAEGRAF